MTERACSCGSGALMWPLPERRGFGSGNAVDRLLAERFDWDGDCPGCWMTVTEVRCVLGLGKGFANIVGRTLRAHARSGDIAFRPCLHNAGFLYCMPLARR